MPMLCLHRLLSNNNFVLGTFIAGILSKEGGIRHRLKNCNDLKVHKREKFFGSDFEFFTIL